MPMIPAMIRSSAKRATTNPDIGPLSSIKKIRLCRIIHVVFAFVETPLFTRLVYDYLSDDEYVVLQQALVENPEAGELIPASGGVRKLRWALKGRGKRGSLRVIYYVRTRQGIVWMLTLYAKNVTENIPAHVLRKIRQEMEDV